MDDGKPGFGRIRHYTPNIAPVANCVTSSSADTAEYNVTNTTFTCAPFYYFGF
jgi:hypothetical protein